MAGVAPVMAKVKVKGLDHNYYFSVRAQGLKIRYTKYEPCHDKTCFCHMRKTKTQFSLRIWAAWSAPLLFAA